MSDLEYRLAADDVLPSHGISEGALRPSRCRLVLRGAALLAFAVLTTLGAQAAVRLPGTPVPLTLQTLFVLLAGVTLGPRLGALSMLFYLALGLGGYHVFAVGSLGLPALLGPTGGYLLGFVLAQPVLGWLTDKPRLSWPTALPALLAGQFVIYAVGLTWLSVCLHTDLKTTLSLGLCPFIPALIIKALLAAVAAPRLLRARRALGLGQGVNRDAGTVSPVPRPQQR